MKFEKENFFENLAQNYSQRSFKLNIDTPFEKHVVYSAHHISGEVLQSVIVSSMDACQLSKKQFFPEDMSIEICCNKVVRIYVDDDILISEDDAFVVQKLGSSIRTQIVFDINRSVDGTELAIFVLKNLQKRFKETMFWKSNNLQIYCEDIQHLYFDGNFMRDPILKDILEKS